MTSFQKGVWMFLILIALYAGYKFFYFHYSTVKLEGIKKSHSHSNHWTDTTSQCSTTSINFADSLTLLQNLKIPPYIVSNILKYRSKIKFFVSEKDFQKVYGITKVYSKIQHCISYQLVDKPKINLNTADTNDFATFLPNYLSTRIFKYRKKIGGFTDWKEFYQVYGLDTHHFVLLQHFGYLGAINNQNNTTLSKSKNQLQKFNLNLADSIQLEKLPRIGHKIASRIIKYRKLLPFFIHFDQLYEVYGMNDTIINIIKESACIEKPKDYKSLNFNELDYFQLSKHPYIGKQNAKILMNYKNMHGNFHSWEDLKKVKELQLKNIHYLQQYFIIIPK